jgi:hypothetical protein
MKEESEEVYESYVIKGYISTTKDEYGEYKPQEISIFAEMNKDHESGSSVEYGHHVYQGTMRICIFTVRDRLV